MEFTDRHWEQTQVINGQTIEQAARAYSFYGETLGTGMALPGEYRGFISTWEGEPGNPSPLGVLVNYNGGPEARNLTSTLVNGVLHGVADPADVDRVLVQAEMVWPGISARYNGNAVVPNWIGPPSPTWWPREAPSYWRAS